MPEIFRPDCSVQALLAEYHTRKQTFMQQSTAAGYMGFNQESSFAEPAATSVVTHGRH